MARSIIEACESRTLLTVFVVDTLADGPTGPVDGKLSLREAIVAANNNVAVGDAPAGSANGDVIRFSASLANKTIVLTAGQIGISDDLVIDGQSRNVTISGNNANRIFIVNMNQPLAISKVRLANGSVSGSGGAMFLSGGGSTQLTGVSVTDSVAGGPAATQGGGAIYNLDQDLTIRDSTLERNVASGAAGSGGAIFTASGVVQVKNSTLRQNVANRAGGGVEITVGSLLLDNTRLLGNRAGTGTGATPAPGNGGGVHVTGAASVRVANNSLVQNNRAASEGGGLWNSATGTMTVTDSKVDANSAFGNAADNGGGGIFNDGGTLVVAYTEVDDNVASGTAGSGGGIFSVAGSLTVTGGVISDNVASRAGGGVEVIAGAARFTEVDLIRNVTASNPGNGGGLHVTGAADTSFLNSLIQNNRAASEGGGLWNSATGTMTVTNSKVDANTASGDAADNGGGGIFNNGGTLTVTGTEIDDNIADGTAGSGGGIFSVAGLVTVTDSLVTDNRARRAGGGVEIISGNLTLDAVNLSGNFASPAAGTTVPGNGGGLHVTATGAVVLVVDSFVRNNFAINEGGGLWNAGGVSRMTVRNTIIESNASFGTGGGGVFNNGGVLVVEDSTIQRNQAVNTPGAGGGLYNNGPAGNAMLARVAFNNNIAETGGAIFTAAGALTTLNAVTFSSNTPDDTAGPGTVV